MKNYKKIEKNKDTETDNTKLIGGFVIGLIVGVVVMFILWPDRIAKLKDGEESVASLGSFNISADDLYTELKKGSPMNALLNLIDGHILHEKYDLEKEAEEYAKKEAEDVFTSYETYYGYSKVEFLEMNGFASEEAFIDYLKEDYYYQTYFDDYTKESITDKDINDYYKDNVIGDMEVVIFTSADSKSDLEGVRSLLKKGKSVDEIKKKYSKVIASEVKVTYQDKLEYPDSIWKKFKSTKAKNYSEVFEDSSYGYVVVYVKSAKDKSDLKDIKDEVEELVIKDKQESDNSLFYKALIKLREDNDLKIYDSELKKLYDDYVKSYK